MEDETLREGETLRRYGDMIHLPHHQSEVHAHMPLSDRAAQFSPFAALTGYGEAVAETARLTEAKPELTEEARSALNDRLSYLKYHLEDQTEVSILYFVPDGQKSGGVLVTETGVVTKIDPGRRLVVLQKLIEIPIDHILEIFFEW